jgi:hypothetical protein
MMYKDDELPDHDDRDDPRERESQPKRRLLVWPWLVLVGAVAIAIGVIGPLLS